MRDQFLLARLIDEGEGGGVAAVAVGAALGLERGGEGQKSGEGGRVS